MASQWVRKSGMTLERRANSANGSPRFFACFADGTRIPTATDAAVNFRIQNESDYAGREIEIEIDGQGEIIDVRQVTA